MRSKYVKAAMMALTITILMTGCGKADNKVTVQESGKTITILEPSKQEESSPKISAAKIDRYEKVIITDWLNENTVILSKENETLDKMSLAELSEHYPRSLYSLDINTKEYQLIKEQKDGNLEEARLSLDKKYLLYSMNTLGDPSYYLMNMDTLDTYGLAGEPIGAAMSAQWTDKNTVIGAAYSGGAYLADLTGKLTLIDELKEEALYLLIKIGNSIYYTTQYDNTLMKLNLETKEKSAYLEQVLDIIPSPDGKQMLIIQYQPELNKQTMSVYDLESGDKLSIVEGAELDGIYGVSWSADQRRIAYNLKEDVNNKAVRSLYVYDMLTGEASQIAVDVFNLTTSWSPSGDKLACTEWDGTWTRINSSIIHLQ